MGQGAAPPPEDCEEGQGKGDGDSVNPGATRTEMRGNAYPDEDPLTLPTPADIAEIFVYLASDESASVTAQAFEARDYLKRAPA